MKDITCGICKKTKEIEEDRHGEKEQDDPHPDVAGPRHESDQGLDAEPFQDADKEGGCQTQNEQDNDDDLGGSAGSESGPEFQKKIKMETAVQQEECQEKEGHGRIIHRDQAMPDLFFTGDDKDRDRAASDDFFGDASKDDMLYPRSAMRAYHDNIDILLSSELEDFLIFPAGFGDDPDFRFVFDLAQILILISLIKILPDGCFNFFKIFLVRV
jgi:hypothetical protein